MTASADGSSFSGFSGPIDVFDVTQPDRVTRTRLNADAIFAGEAGHRYWAVGPQGYRSGRVEAAQLTPDLRAAENAAAYLAIGPIDLLEPLQPLVGVARGARLEDDGRAGAMPSTISSARDASIRKRSDRSCNTPRNSGR